MRSNHRRRGGVLLYVTVAMVLFMGFTSLAVDYAHVRVVKIQLQTAADAAARHAVTGLPNATTATTYAQTAAAANKADGTSIALASSDVEFGVWDSTARTFTSVTGTWLPSATAVRVTVRRASSSGNAVSTFFGKIIGLNSVDVKAIAIAAIGTDHNVTVPALACPWLAGMPIGTHMSGYGPGSNAPTESPVQISGYNVVPGRTIQFRNTQGQTADTDSGGVYGLDGSPTRVTIHQTADFGIADTEGPLNALMGIFLDDNEPDSTGVTASSLDFSTQAARDFTTFSPQLKQVFFIGDGLTSSNQLQNFVVPHGATRLFLGVMDEQAHWYDNLGQITTTVYDGQITLVQ
jgi:Flp pilus assembly protein TadG